VGLDVILETEDREQLDSVSDPRNLLHGLFPASGDRSFRCLSYVDWYGDTIFNHLQFDDLISELDTIHTKAISVEERALLEQIRSMVLRGKQEVHVYVRFEGD
jgi:hypothetical protein